MGEFRIDAEPPNLEGEAGQRIIIYIEFGKVDGYVVVGIFAIYESRLLQLEETSARFYYNAEK
ncbi:hypothetical protein HPP92_009794 [Vanilla planifolia]|uniref:Uncharacterized protein n=1 Tax=Vanilla planifolia TaxID=51239 RepID=A0A835RD17_VANPL|nr:hypothetical protein HPP92_009794 [Vanilla planifolia]